MPGRERVVITGLGIISCLGNDCARAAASLFEGRSGVELLEERKKLGFNSGLSGVIRDFDLDLYLTRKQRKTLPEFGIWAWAAIEQALGQAGIGIESLSGDEQTGLIFGNDSSAATPVEQVDILRSSGETRSIGSGHIFRSLTSTITLNISTLLGIRGMSWTVASACASGAMAIGQGAELIAGGRQKRMICGGAQEITWESMCSFDTLNAFSRRENAPAEASRPFDTERDGLVPSGGAACLVLESLNEAKGRGATVLGEVAGYGISTDGHHIVVPSGEGIERSMNMAISSSGLQSGDIDLVLAHATSTPAGDEKEAEALTRVFSANDAHPYIFAPKALTGHEFWMAGASQAVYGLLMARNGFIAGNRNLRTPDPAASSLNLPRTNVRVSPRILLCNASGFGGTNASLVLRT
ncbi:MAG: beta-ketoacyl-[acyl-carrier-protein] synthase family protein [Desulfobulbaceae bacterium]|nr:beta-ketoacyl-[acyl-carrier-protein] synthase family protein [Desulfobulbaceae bacterium]